MLVLFMRLFETPSTFRGLSELVSTMRAANIYDFISYKALPLKLDLADSMLQK